MDYLIRGVSPKHTPLINVEDVDDVANIIVPPLKYLPHHLFYHRGTLYFASFPTFPSSFGIFLIFGVVCTHISRFARVLFNRLQLDIWLDMLMCVCGDL